MPTVDGKTAVTIDGKTPTSINGIAFATVPTAPVFTLTPVDVTHVLIQMAGGYSETGTAPVLYDYGWDTVSRASYTAMSHQISGKTLAEMQLGFSIDLTGNPGATIYARMRARNSTGTVEGIKEETSYDYFSSGMEGWTDISEFDPGDGETDPSWGTVAIYDMPLSDLSIHKVLELRGAGSTARAGIQKIITSAGNLAITYLDGETTPLQIYVNGVLQTAVAMPPCVLENGNYMPRTVNIPIPSGPSKTVKIMHVDLRVIDTIEY